MSNDQPSKSNRCLVLKSFCLKKGKIHRKWKKNDQGMYVVNAKSNQRIQNVVSLNDADMKKALKLKAIEVVD